MFGLHLYTLVYLHHPAPLALLKLVRLTKKRIELQWLQGVVTLCTRYILILRYHHASGSAEVSCLWTPFAAQRLGGKASKDFTSTRARRPCRTCSGQLAAYLVSIRSYNELLATPVTRPRHLLPQLPPRLCCCPLRPHGGPRHGRGLQSVRCLFKVQVGPQHVWFRHRTIEKHKSILPFTIFCLTLLVSMSAFCKSGCSTFSFTQNKAAPTPPLLEEFEMLENNEPLFLFSSELSRMASVCMWPTCDVVMPRFEFSFLSLPASGAWAKESSRESFGPFSSFSSFSSAICTFFMAALMAAAPEAHSADPLCWIPELDSVLMYNICVWIRKCATTDRIG